MALITRLLTTTPVSSFSLIYDDATNIIQSFVVVHQTDTPAVLNLIRPASGNIRTTIPPNTNRTVNIVAVGLTLVVNTRPSLLDGTTIPYLILPVGSIITWTGA